MATDTIIEALDISKDVTFGFLSCCIVTVMDELGFERMEEALHRGIVVAVALPAHRGSEAGGLDRLSVICRGILNAAIGMVDQAGTSSLRRDRHPQGCQRQVSSQMIRHRPADDPSGVEVQDRGQIEPALISLDVGDVGQPNTVWRVGDEVAVKQVWSDREVVPTVGGPHLARPRHDGPDAVMAHQSLDSAPACPTALSLQFFMDTGAAITSAVVAMDALDVLQEVAIVGGSLALRARSPGIIAGWRHLEH